LYVCNELYGVLMKLLIVLFLIFSSSFLISQEQINIYPQKKLHKISELIYGSNQTLIPNVTTAMRLGGNRLTGYNWVNNYSNAGSDWQHSSDNYLPWVMGIPESDYEKTGIVLTKFHQNNINNNCYSLITVPMTGYVAKDKLGTIDENQIAPSYRWAKVINQKGKAFDLHPKINSDTVYVDECINFLNNYFKDSKQIDAFSLDNEPALWAYTHPRLHPDKITVKELIAKSVELAKTIKKMSPESEIFGPALYGFNAYLSLQDAPDWTEYKSKYDRFIDTYLDIMRSESDETGKRLIDVLDVHWYPEPEGVYSGDTSRAASIRRMESIRSLWDSTYIEESWIGQWFSPVAILKYLKISVSKYYPNTKIGITEYNYSANKHISGGIAQALFLGVLGKENIYFASKWDEISGFNKLVFEIFRNYDGKNSKFGNISIENDADNKTGLSIFSSVDEIDTTVINIIAINSDYDKEKDFELVINATNDFNKYDKFSILRNSNQIEKSKSDLIFLNNKFADKILPLSINHYIVKIDKINSVGENHKKICIYPNPASDYIEISGPELNKGLQPLVQNVRIFNTLGIEVAQPSTSVIYNSISKDTNTTQTGASELLKIDISNLPDGLYFIKIGKYSGKFVVLR
jgi:mannan endo-1,4-beta-mannosidase